jgi:SAM-dependent methyltransferase
MQIAYVAVSPERLRAAMSRIERAEKERRVSQWRRAFDHVYRRGLEDHAPSFVGWTSNFSNKPIPEAHMTEWLQCTVERIRSLGGKRILEVGCGVGLLLEQLAPGADAYCGTDLSPAAIDRLRAFASRRPAFKHVELLEREAVDFSELALHSFDTVVINSVAQYFPSLDYLHEVLEQALRVVASGGRIFVGDVRDSSLLQPFHAAVQFAKTPKTASVGSLKRKLAIERERELAVDPDFFRRMSSALSRVTGVDVLIKRGSDTELTRYRYDVVLHVAQPPAATSRLKEVDAGVMSNEALLEQLAQKPETSVGIRRLCNSRVVRDLHFAEALSALDDDCTPSDIAEHIAVYNDTARDPESYYRLAEETGRNVSVTCSRDLSGGFFDVTFATRGQVRVASSTMDASPSENATPESTYPMVAAFLQQLGLELGNDLQAKFNDTRLPDAVIALDDNAFDEFTRAPSLVPSLVAGRRSNLERVAD